MVNFLEIGVDVGGTFTDIVCLKGKEIFVTKVNTTPKDLSKGIIEGVAKILKTANGKHEEVKRLVHGSTVAINAILQRKGVVTGILMTKGFEDMLVIGRQGRRDLYDLFAEPDTPGFIAPKRMRIGINERVDYQGNIIIPLDEKAVRTAASKLKELYSVEAIIVCYLFSFASPEHELRTREIIKQTEPDIWVSLSCEVDPIFREYERLVITAFNAYIGPIVDMYITKIENELNRINIDAKFQIMQSRGGITSAKLVREKPVNMIMSGPAAGAIGAAFVGQSVKADLSGDTRDNFITLDIGGTSCDVALIYQGKPMITTEANIDKYPIRRAMIGINSIGAGGGSLVWLDSAGGLKVGPQSTGANPGPACYGWGGVEPTVTDASLVLGFLNPDYFAAGEVKLDIDAAIKAIEKIAIPLGLDVFTTASGIHKVMNSKIAEQVKLVSLRRGYDPRDFYLVAFGGGGPVHTGILAKELSIPLSIIPATPGVLSAFGLLVADLEHENSRTLVARLGEGNGLVSKIASDFQQLIDTGNRQMEEDGVSLDKVRIRKSADMRYIGQSYELEITLAGNISRDSLKKAIKDFHTQHELLYGYNRLGTTVEFVNLRTVHYYSSPTKMGTVTGGKSLEVAQKGTRRVYFEEFMEVTLYEREKLPLKQIIDGPAIIEQPDCTTVVYPGQQCFVGSSGNLLLKNRTQQGE
ncbi:hydantoinase/oxoprolinase family protein [Chloroflexota bacterium]